MKKLILLYILLLILFSCQQEVDFVPKDYPYIILNEVSVNSSGAEILATLYGESENSISEYGLAIAQHESPDISDRIILMNMDNESTKEFMIQLDHDLSLGETYYVKTFIKYSEKIIYSNEVSFISAGCLPAEITSFNVDSATSGNIINITGNNFSELASNNSVYFSDMEATVIKSCIDTLTVFCPNTSSNQTVKVKVTVANQTTESVQNFKLLNPWRRIQDFPANPTIYNGQFVSESTGFLIPGGVIADSDEEKQLFWEFDLNSYEWNILSNLPFTNRLWAIGFASRRNVYCGVGRYESDLWQFNLDSKVWTQKSSYPGLGRYSSGYPVFQLNNSVYLYSYQDGSGEFWKYLIDSDEWIQLPTPTELLDKEFSWGFTYKNKRYLLEIIEGADFYAFGVWEFDETSNSFIRTHYESVNSRIEAGSFIIGDNLYIPTRMGKLIQYSLSDNSVFYLDDPSDIYEFGFVFQNTNKAIVSMEQTKEVYEFQPR